MEHPHNKTTPRHVAIIMDGNRRWAVAQGKETLEGHSAGVASLQECVIVAKELGVEYLTAYAFSTENWGRPQGEVDAIMALFSAVIIDQAEELAKNQVALRIIGNRAGLAEDLQEKIAEVEMMEVAERKMTLSVAMNYSARWDIMNAASGFGDSFDERGFRSRLSTRELPDVDLLIRTGGQRRLSNFLLWESSYAELYFSEVLWPEYRRDDFVEALAWFCSRNRTYGLR